MRRGGRSGPCGSGRSTSGRGPIERAALEPNGCTAARTRSGDRQREGHHPRRAAPTGRRRPGARRPNRAVGTNQDVRAVVGGPPSSTRRAVPSCPVSSTHTVTWKWRLQPLVHGLGPHAAARQPPRRVWMRFGRRLGSRHEVSGSSPEAHSIWTATCPRSGC